MAETKLIDDLKTLPGIVGNMGKSIANAQKLLNLDYLQNVKAFVTLARQHLGKDQTNVAALEQLLRELAPPRYQFTETRIDFSADLYESEKLAAGASLSAGWGAVAISAAASYGVRSDYRAAARVTSTLHAIPSETEQGGNVLLERVKELTKDDKLPLPAGSPEVDTGKTLTEIAGLLKKDGN